MRTIAILILTAILFSSCGLLPKEKQRPNCMAKNETSKIQDYGSI